MKEFKDRLNALSLEQDSLVLTPSSTTPVRLAEIAEEKRFIGKLLIWSNQDRDVAKGIIEARYKEVMESMLLRNLSQSEYSLHYKAWYNVASILLTEQEMSALTNVTIQYEDDKLPSTVELVVGAIDVMKQRINNFSKKYFYKDEEI